VRALHAEAHRSLPLVAGAAGWMAMTVAMMLPGTLPVARVHALGALWARRRRTVGLFLGAYLAVWGAFGAVAAWAVALTEPGVGRGALLAAVLAAGAAWELASAKWRAVRLCHRVTPLPPRGARADLACVRAGVVYGGRCVAVCWACMLAMAVAAHTRVGLMVLLGAIVTAERLLARPARHARSFAAVLAFAALVSIAG
jgi:predicted metal-binding membrane protein